MILLRILGMENTDKESDKNVRNIIYCGVSYLI